MWKLKIAEGGGSYLFSTNNYVGRQIWEFAADGGTPEERAAVEKAREDYKNNCKKDRGGRALPSGDLLTRMQIISLHISGAISSIITEEHRKELIRFGYLHQNDDGGWGFYLEGQSTMFGTALNYVTLRLLGEGLDDGENGAMAKARKWIIDNGGATGLPSWGKFFMSVLGIYEWSGCNPLPPEFWLFPSFSPYHPGKMWCYCRMVYMPMSYLYGRKFHGPVTDLVKSLRREIYTTPYEEINWNKARHDCCKADLYYPHSFIQDLLWVGLHYVSEPIMNIWPFNKIRKRALEKSIKHLRYSGENSRYITTGAVETSLQIMCWFAEDPNAEELKYHLARVPDYLWVAEDGMKMNNLGSPLWDCAFAIQALISSDMVEECSEALKKAHFYIKESQVRENPSGDFKSMYRQLTKGSWTLSDKDQAWAVSDCTAEALKCLLLLSQMSPEMVGEEANVERLYDAVNLLLYLQSPKSGGFSVWEPPIPQPYLQGLNPSECFADIMIEREHVECTASIVQALVTFKSLYPLHREKELENSVSKAIHFLEEKQLPDGSWYGYWGVCFIYGTFFVLRGLASVGKTYNNSEAIRRGVGFLLSIQNEEGGWGESLESCPSMKYQPLERNRTNLVQTSWAMLGLLFGGQVERDPTPLHKAAKILLNAQMDDGDFPQQEITGASLKNLMIHYAHYKNIFPLWALGEYRKHVWSPSQKI